MFESLNENSGSTYINHDVAKMKIRKLCKTKNAVYVKTTFHICHCFQFFSFRVSHYIFLLIIWHKFNSIEFHVTFL